jgi:hypothetical protein
LAAAQRAVRESLGYFPFGNVTLSPDVPTTKAGIATLNPIPSSVNLGHLNLMC